MPATRCVTENTSQISNAPVSCHGEACYYHVLVVETTGLMACEALQLVLAPSELQTDGIFDYLTPNTIASSISRVVHTGVK